MTIQPIGDESVALYITPADLRARGLTPETLTAEAALDLTRDACAQAGFRLVGSLEIEAYPDKCGVLVFARVDPDATLWLSFPNFEDLLTALRSVPLPPEEDAALLWWEDRWWLSLPPAARQAHTALSEFGDAEIPSPQLEALLAEHGQAVASGPALSALPGHFTG